MDCQKSQRSKMATVALMGAFLACAGQVLSAQANSSDSNALRLEGTWLVQVTLRVCATGAPLGTVNSLVTFARGGTMSESVGAGGFESGQRSDGHGDWRHIGGRTYSQRFVVLIRFDTPPNPPTSPGFLAGWQIVTHTLTLVDRDNFSSSGTNEFFDASGNSYRSGCSTAMGWRFK
jgi:hypothetical protein